MSSQHGVLSPVSPAQAERRRSIQEMKEKQHILFVCGRNQWRSPTATRIARSRNASAAAFCSI